MGIKLEEADLRDDEEGERKAGGTLDGRLLWGEAEGKGWAEVS